MILNNNGKIETVEIETKVNISNPSIRVYATTTEADLFLNGIDNQIENKLIELLVNENEMDETTVKMSMNDMKNDFKKSIENSIEWLPKKERLELNYTLIYLTALKQKISPELKPLEAIFIVAFLKRIKKLNG